MKFLIVALLLLIVLHPSQGQKTQSLEGMKGPEIRKFLMNQTESKIALEMIKKHNASRISSIIFLGSATILMIVSTESTDEVTTVETAAYSAISLAISIATSIAANARLKKAVKLYENDIQKAQLQPSIRSELIQFEKAKYPTPH